MVKPIIAITTGDPAGIGPEIALKSASDGRVREVCRPLLIGDFGILEFFRARFDLPFGLNSVSGVDEARYGANEIDVLNVPNLPIEAFEPGVATAHLLLGRTYEETGEGERALAAYRRALVLDPSLVEASRAIDRLSGAGRTRPG